MSEDVPLPFDDALVEEHAVQHDLAPADLREALRAVQATADRHVGVDGLVYEWRGAFAEDPLVARSPGANSVSPFTARTRRLTSAT